MSDEHENNLDEPGKAANAAEGEAADQSGSIVAPNTTDVKDDDPDKTKYENLLRREPYDFVRCTVTLTLQLLPDDDDPAGRPVVLGVQDHGFAPTIRFARLTELALPPALTEMLDAQAHSMSEREQACQAEREAAQQQKAEAEARRAARKTTPKAAKQKLKKVKVTDLPPPTPPSPAHAAATTPAPITSEKPQQSGLFEL